MLIKINCLEKLFFFYFLILDYLLDYPSFSHVKEYDGPVHIQYASYPARFNSFNDWPIGLNQKPGAMAKAGFFYTGKNLISLFQNKENIQFFDQKLQIWHLEIKLNIKYKIF